MSNLEVLASAPILVVQLVVNGILVGAIFALVAYGMALVWGVMNIINVAQGELVMVGGYIVFYLDGAGIHPWLGIPIAAI
ncbi:MAG TPA: branched-chain amino acid ABC transporter permease, partial [Casimicrobiaceae bacterium]